jgi:hypothetical protein
MDDRVSQAPEVALLDLPCASRAAEQADIFLATIADRWQVDARPLRRASSCALEAVGDIGPPRLPVRLSVARDESDLYLRLDLPGAQVWSADLDLLDRALVWAPIDSHSVTVDEWGLLVVLQLACRVAMLDPR